MRATYVMDGEVGIVPLDGVATLGLHDVESFQHDRGHQVQPAKVQPLLVRELTPEAARFAAYGTVREVEEIWRVVGNQKQQYGGGSRRIGYGCRVTFRIAVALDPRP